MIVVRYAWHGRPLLRGVAPPGRSGRFRRTLIAGCAGSAGSGSRKGERHIIPAALMLRLSPIPGFTAAINPFGAAAGCERGREFALAKWPIRALTARPTARGGVRIRAARPGPGGVRSGPRTRRIDRRG